MNREQSAGTPRAVLLRLYTSGTSWLVIKLIKNPLTRRTFSILLNLQSTALKVLDYKMKMSFGAIQLSRMFYLAAKTKLWTQHEATTSQSMFKHIVNNVYSRRKKSFISLDFEKHAISMQTAIFFLSEQRKRGRRSLAKARQKKFNESW